MKMVGKYAIILLNSNSNFFIDYENYWSNFSLPAKSLRIYVFIYYNINFVMYIDYLPSYKNISLVHKK